MLPEKVFSQFVFAVVDVLTKVAHQNQGTLTHGAMTP
jgi:hypothetical protein